MSLSNPQNQADNTSSSTPVDVLNTVPVSQSGTWTVGLSSESIEIGSVDQGTPNTLANGWPVEITDGTNILGTSSHPLRIDPTGTTTQPISGSVSVSNFPATQAVTQSTSPWVVSLTSTTITGTVAVTQSTSPWVVSGSVTANIGTTNGLALNTTLTNGSQQSQIVDGADSVVGPIQTISGTNYLPVVLASSGTTGTAVPSRTIQVGGSDGTNLRTLKVSTTGVLSVDGSATTQPISGTVTANAGTGTFTVGQSTGTNLHTVVDSGSITVTQSTAANLNATVTGTVTSNQGTAAALAGAWPVEMTDGTNILGTSAHPIRVDPTGTTTQPVSGTVTANQGGAPWTFNETQINGSAVVTAVSGVQLIGLADGSGNTISSTSNTLNVHNSGGNVSLGISTGKSVVMKTGTLVTTAVTADQVVLTYTVTTGKTFYVEYVDFQGSFTTPANTAAVIGTISLETPSGTKVFETRFFNSSVGTYGQNSTRFAEPIPVLSATVIRIVTTPGVTTSITWFGNFGGYEV